MDFIEKLDQLRQSQLAKKKLNRQETREAYDSILGFLSSSQQPSACYDYILAFPPEAGVRAFVEYLSRLDVDQRKVLLDEFAGSEQFKQNINNRTVRRGLAMTAMLVNSGFGQDEVLNLLVATCRLAIRGSSDISAQVAKYVWAELLQPCEPNILRGDLNFESISEQDYLCIERVMFSTAFSSDSRLEIPPRMQLMVLEWLASIDGTARITEEEKQALNEALLQWPEDLLEELRSNNLIRQKFGCMNKDVEPATAPARDGNTIQGNTVLPSGKTGDIQALVNDVLKSCVTEIEKQFNELIQLFAGLEQQNQELTAMLDRVKKENAKLESERHSLSARLETATRKIAELEGEKLHLTLSLDRMTREKEELRSELQAYQNQFKEMHETINTIAQESVQEFRNKLAYRLRVEYMDFREIEKIEIHSEIARMLKVQMSNIFKELMRNGVTFDL